MDYRIFWPNYKEATEITNAQRATILFIARQFNLTSNIVIEPEFKLSLNEGAVFVRTEDVVYAVARDGHAYK
jgi:hypothetical protein